MVGSWTSREWGELITGRQAKKRTCVGAQLCPAGSSTGVFEDKSRKKRSEAKSGQSCAASHTYYPWKRAGRKKRTGARHGWDEKEATSHGQLSGSACSLSLCAPVVCLGRVVALCLSGSHFSLPSAAAMLQRENDTTILPQPG